MYHTGYDDSAPKLDRLSSTFRFRLGSSSLTRRGELNLLRSHELSANQVV